MNVLDMPIEWQQRSANTFAMPMPVRKTDYVQWLTERDLPVDAAEVVANAGSPKKVATSNSMALAGSRR